MRKTYSLPEAEAPLPLGGVLRARFLIVACIACAAAVVAGGRGDWNYFVRVGDHLLREGPSAYVAHPDAQTGPLSLIIASILGATWRNGFLACVVISGALGLCSLRTIERMALARDRDVDRDRLKVLVGGVLLAYWWSRLGGYGHLDDALVLSAALLATAWTLDGRRLPAAIVLGLAIAVKPWAVIFLPVLWWCDDGWRGRARSLAIAVAVGAIAWVPILVAEPDALRALRPTVALADDSVLSLLGLTDASMPSGIRAAQLVGAGAVAMLAVMRGRPEGALAAAVAVRIATDPGTWSYYTPGLVLGALVIDLTRPQHAFPWWCVATSLLVGPTWLIASPDLRAVGRVCALVLVLAAVLVRRRPHEAAPTVVDPSARAFHLGPGSLSERLT